MRRQPCERGTDTALLDLDGSPDVACDAAATRLWHQAQSRTRQSMERLCQAQDQAPGSKNLIVDRKHLGLTGEIPPATAPRPASIGTLPSAQHKLTATEDLDAR
jgi:hypothetical protein